MSVKILIKKYEYYPIRVSGQNKFHIEINNLIPTEYAVIEICFNRNNTQLVLCQVAESS